MIIQKCFSTDFVKAKGTHWFYDYWVDVIRKHMQLPLNDEMIKQTLSFEGDTEFLDKLYIMCDPRATWIELNEKQINLMCRVLLAYYDLPIMLVKWASHTLLQQGLKNKDIELKMKQIKEICDEEKKRTNNIG